MEESIETFFEKYYLPQLEKYVYHQLHFIMFGKNVTSNARKNCIILGHIYTDRDDAEGFVFKSNEEIQSEHFGDS